MLNVECWTLNVSVARAVLAERCCRLHLAFQGVRFMESFVFRSDLLIGHEPARTRDEDEDEDEKRGQLPPVPHPASRIPHFALGRFMGSVRLNAPPALDETRVV